MEALNQLENNSTEDEEVTWKILLLYILSTFRDNLRKIDCKVNYFS